MQTVRNNSNRITNARQTSLEGIGKEELTE